MDASGHKTCKGWMFSVYFIILVYMIRESQCFMDMEELKSVYYGLNILNEPVSMEKEVPDGSVHVTSKFGQQYRCTFPDHSTEEKRKEEEEKLALEMGIVEMLKPMGNAPCLFKAKDWWSYEFCFGKYMRQFHVDDGEIKGAVIYLGYYQDDFDWTNETARDARLKMKTGQGRYHSQNYTQGTKCDLTGQPRRAEVRFVCEENSEDYLSRVDESETCVYTVTVATARICRHPDLKAPARRKPVPITCNPLLSGQEYESYMHELEEARVKESQRKYESAKSLEKLFTSSEGTILSKDEFFKMFGDDETLWQAYLTFKTRRKTKQKEEGERLRKIAEEMGEDTDDEDETSSQGEQPDKEDKEAAKISEEDEDEEIISSFEDELRKIRDKFDSSQKSITQIKKKVAWERKWEAEIEEAIQEAEQEFGVKVDRSLVSGLTNTLDKLMSKLQDTESELASAGEELGKLKPGKPILTSGSESEHAGDQSEETQDGVSEQVTVKDKEKGDEEKESDKVSAELSKAPPGSTTSDNTQTEIPPGSASDPSSTDMKILAPPKTGSEQSSPGPSSRPERPLTMQEEEEGIVGGSSVIVEDGGSDKLDSGAKVSAATDTAEDNDDGVGGGKKVDSKKMSDDDEDEDEEPEVTVTLTKVEDDGDAKLPKGVQKLLEESVKREFKKNRMDSSDAQPLTFDTDHSFQRDQTVHVIQSEDEDGKTNRYIFVFGFNSNNDEAAEKQRQTSLEENYGFVYKGNKNKKESSPPPIS